MDRDTDCPVPRLLHEPRQDYQGQPGGAGAKGLGAHFRDYVVLDAVELEAGGIAASGEGDAFAGFEADRGVGGVDIRTTAEARHAGMEIKAEGGRRGRADFRTIGDVATDSAEINEGNFNGLRETEGDDFSGAIDGGVNNTEVVFVGVEDAAGGSRGDRQGPDCFLNAGFAIVNISLIEEAVTLLGADEGGDEADNEDFNIF